MVAFFLLHLDSLKRDGMVGVILERHDEVRYLTSCFPGCCAFHVYMRTLAMLAQLNTVLGIIWADDRQLICRWQEDISYGNRLFT